MTTQVAVALGRLRSMLAAETVRYRLTVLQTTCKANFNPSQPRVPAGSPDGGQWTGGGGGSGGGGRNGGGSGGGGGGINERRVLSDAPSEDDELKPGTQLAQLRGPRGPGAIRWINGQPFQLSPGQTTRAQIAEAQLADAIGRVRTLDPSWQPAPRVHSNVERYIENTQEIAREAQARYDTLRSGIGGNTGFPPTNLPTARAPHLPRLNPQTEITNFRAAINSRDLFGNETVSKDKGAVSYSELDGTRYYGVSSDMPTHTSIDRRSAQVAVDTLAAKYPDTMNLGNIGWKPNDALYHAEATILLRMAQNNGGTLKDRMIVVHVDKSMCTSCQPVLPKLGLELGNPIVSFIDRSGKIQTMWNGDWLD
jgi:hypothetical protein